MSYSRGSRARCQAMRPKYPAPSFDECLRLRVGHVDVVGVAAAVGCESVIGGHALEHGNTVDVNTVLSEGRGEGCERNGREADGN